MILFPWGAGSFNKAGLIRFTACVINAPGVVAKGCSEGGEGDVAACNLLRVHLCKVVVNARVITRNARVGVPLTA